MILVWCALIAASETKEYLDHTFRVTVPFHVARVGQPRARLVTVGFRTRLWDIGGARGIRSTGSVVALDGVERLYERGHERLLLGLRVGDPDRVVEGAWFAKESVRDIYLTGNIGEAAIFLDKAMAGCKQAGARDQVARAHVERLAPGDPQPPDWCQQRPHRGSELCVKR